MRKKTFLISYNIYRRVCAKIATKATMLYYLDDHKLYGALHKCSVGFQLLMMHFPYFIWRLGRKFVLLQTE